MFKILGEVFPDTKQMQSERLWSLITYNIEGATTLYLSGKKRWSMKQNSPDITVSAMDSDTEVFSQQALTQKQGLLPDIWGECWHFDSLIEWKKVGWKRIPEPKRGLNDKFDKANDEVDRIKYEIQKYFNSLKKKHKMPDLKLNEMSWGFVSG